MPQEQGVNLGGITDFVSSRLSDDATKIAVAACALLATLGYAAYEIRGHQRNWILPNIQKYMVRLLLVCPLYCVTSFMSLLFPASLPTTIAVQGFGLAFLMYTYMELMVGYFAPSAPREEALAKAGDVISALPAMIPIPPCCLPCHGCRRFTPGEIFLRDKVLRPTRCFQWVVIVIAVLGVYLSPYHFWNFGQNDGGPWMWLNFVQLGTLIWALSGLLPAEQVFEKALKGDFGKARLAHLLFNPLPMALQDIVMPSIIGAPTWFGTYRDAVVCVECAIFSIVFAWAFGYTAFQAHKDDHMCTMNGHWAYSKAELLSKYGGDGAGLMTETKEASSPTSASISGRGTGDNDAATVPINSSNSVV